MVVVAVGGDAEHDTVPVADVVVEFVDGGMVDDAAGPVRAVEIVGAVDRARLLRQRVVAENLLSNGIEAAGGDDVAGERLVLEEAAGGGGAGEGVVDLISGAEFEQGGEVTVALFGGGDGGDDASGGAAGGDRFHPVVAE